MKTRGGIEGSHRGKGPLKRPRFSPEEDSPEPETSTDDQDGDPDYAISKKPSPPKQKCKRTPLVLEYPDELPDLEPIPPRSQPRTKCQVKQIPSKKKKCQRQNQVESSDSDTEPAESDDPGEEPQNTPESRAIKQKSPSASGVSNDSDTEQTIELSSSEASNNSDIEQPVQGSPSGVSSDVESPKRRTTKRKQNRIKDSSNSDTEPAEPDTPEAAPNDGESHRTADDSANTQKGKQKRKKRRICQRQMQDESSDSETESRQPESTDSGPNREEPQRSSNRRGNSQLPQRRSTRINTRQNRPFRKPTRNDVYDEIELDAGRPRKSAITKKAAGFTRETHFYNRDNLSESETSSVDEYVKGKFTKEVPREQAEREEREREATQEHEYRQMNLAIEQQQWEREREILANEIADIERRYGTASAESSASDDEDSQPRPEEAYQTDDDNGTVQNTVATVPIVVAPNLPAVPMMPNLPAVRAVPSLPAAHLPVHQPPSVCPYDDDEDDSMYGVDDAPANRPMTNRPDFGPEAIETDEELEAWMLAFDDRDLIDPNVAGGQEGQDEKGSQEVSDDEGSIIIYSDSEEEDASVPVQSANMSAQDIPVHSSSANINEMPAVPSCSKDYSGPVQPMAPSRSDINEMLAVSSRSNSGSNQPTRDPSASDTDQMLAVPSRSNSGSDQPTRGPPASDTDQMLAVPSRSNSGSDQPTRDPSASDTDQMPAVPSCSKDDSGAVQPTMGPTRSDIDDMLAVPSCSNSGSGSVQPIVIQPINGPSGPDVNEALDVPPCSTDHPGLGQARIISSHQELPSRGQLNATVKREETESSYTNGQGNHSVAESASHRVPKEEDIKEDIGVCSQTLVRRQLFTAGGEEIAASTSLQLKAEPTESDNHSVHVTESASSLRVPKEEDSKEDKEFCICSQTAMRHELFAGRADRITASSNQQIKEEPTEGTTDIEHFSAESMSGSLESEQRHAEENVGENGESSVTDDDHTSTEFDEQMITPVKRRSFRLRVSEDEEEEEEEKEEEKPGPSGHHNYARPPGTDTEDETEESSDEGSASSNQNSESDAEGEASSRSGSEYDEDDYGRRRSKRALMTPQKRQYQESMERYKKLRERKKSVAK